MARGRRRISIRVLIFNWSLLSYNHGRHRLSLHFTVVSVRAWPSILIHVPTFRGHVRHPFQTTWTLPLRTALILRNVNPLYLSGTSGLQQADPAQSKLYVLLTEVPNSKISWLRLCAILHDIVYNTFDCTRICSAAVIKALGTISD